MDEVRRNLIEINHSTTKAKLPVRHNQFGRIAAECAELYHSCVIEKGNKSIYELGVKFRKKALLGSNQELIVGLSSLPSEPPQKLVEIVRRAIDDISDDCRELIEDSLTRSLTCLIKTVVQTYQHISKEEMHIFLENFDVYTDKTILSTVKALNKQLLAYTSKGQMAIVGRIDDARDTLDRMETQATLYFMDRHQSIEQRLGPEIAKEFRENVNLFTSIGLGRRIEFTDLYSRFLLDELHPGEEGILAPILVNLAEFSLRKTENEVSLRQILTKGPTKCNGHLVKSLKETTGNDIPFFWDFRVLQKNLYTTYPGFLSYQALVDAGFNEDIYINLAEQLAESGSLEQKLLIIGGGCGIARKEAIMLKELRERLHSCGKRYDVELLLIDNSKPARDLAVMTFTSEQIYAFPNLPPVVDWDLENLHPQLFEKHRDLLKDRQIIFTAFGGVAFNIPNIWGMYSNIRDIFMRRAKGELYDRHPVSRAVIKGWNTIKGSSSKEPVKKRGGATQPDLIITEWNSEKNLDYYYHPASVEFLNRGISAGYQISAKDLAKDDPVFVLDEKNHRVRSFYLLRKGHKLSEWKGQDVPAILVIDSGKPEEMDFDNSMRGVGFRNEFSHHGSSTFAISQAQEPDVVYEPQIRYFIRSFEEDFRG